MNDISDVEAADRIGRRRSRLFLVQAVLFLAWQANFFIGFVAEPMRTVDTVKVSAWFVWVLALLLLLATGGGFLRRPGLRALLNDEFTRANRTRACVAGFWAAMASGILIYFIDLFEPVDAREAMHLLFSFAIAAAFITFAIRERRGPGQ